jgi:hypothetical protein
MAPRKLLSTGSPFPPPPNPTPQAGEGWVEGGEEDPAAIGAARGAVARAYKRQP